ncbi:hypothetical protein HDU83_003433 [Entophlyctis luteolus]|nr:hypothetical protein HDU83_003433 [Entophlyctis luteolus]
MKSRSPSAVSMSNMRAYQQQQQQQQQAHKDDDGSSIRSVSSAKSFSGFINGFKSKLMRNLGKKEEPDNNRRSSGSSASNANSTTPLPSAEVALRVQHQQQQKFVRGLYPSEGVLQGTQPVAFTSQQINHSPVPFTPYMPAPPPSTPQVAAQPRLPDFSRPPPSGTSTPSVPVAAPRPATSSTAAAQQFFAPPVYRAGAPTTAAVQKVDAPLSQQATSDPNENKLQSRFSFETIPESIEAKPIKTPPTTPNLPVISVTYSDEGGSADDLSPSLDESSPQRKSEMPNAAPNTGTLVNESGVNSYVVPGTTQSASLPRRSSEYNHGSSSQQGSLKRGTAGSLDAADGLETSAFNDPGASLLSARSLDRAGGGSNSLSRKFGSLSRGSGASPTGGMQSIVHEDVMLSQRGGGGHLFWVDDAAAGDVHPVKLFADVAAATDSAAPGVSGVDENGYPLPGSSPVAGAMEYGSLLRKRSTLSRILSSSVSDNASDSDVSVSSTTSSSPGLPELDRLELGPDDSLKRTRSFKQSHVVITPKSADETSSDSKKEESARFKVEDIESGTIVTSPESEESQSETDLSRKESSTSVSTLSDVTDIIDIHVEVKEAPAIVDQSKDEIPLEASILYDHAVDFGAAIPPRDTSLLETSVKDAVAVAAEETTDSDVPAGNIALVTKQANGASEQIVDGSGKDRNLLHPEDMRKSLSVSGDDEEGFVYPAQQHSDYYNGFPRFPLHIEKIIYQLSHAKLAQPRRPLLHQVMISNLMLYILSVHADVTVNRQGPRKAKGKKKKGGSGKKKRNGSRVGSKRMQTAAEQESAMAATIAASHSGGGAGDLTTELNDFAERRHGGRRHTGGDGGDDESDTSSVSSAGSGSSFGSSASESDRDDAGSRGRSIRPKKSGGGLFSLFSWSSKKAAVPQSPPPVQPNRTSDEDNLPLATFSGRR